MEANPSVIPVPSPWRAMLLEAVKSTQRHLFFTCPYIKEEVISALRETLRVREIGQTSPLVIRVLTRVLAEDLLSGASDIAALSQLLHWPDQLAGTRVELRAINNLHAKVWVFDEALAIVGSGNATSPGLDANLEYGLAISDQELVARIQQDWEVWWQQAEPVKEEQLDQMREWLERSRAMLQPLMAQVEQTRTEIEQRIGTAPCIGKRLSPSSRNRQARPPRVVEGPAPFAATSMQQEGITLSAAHLCQALNWVAPPLEEETPLRDVPEVFMKLAVTVVSPDEYLLRCVWADGKRVSQSTIAGRTSKAQLSWTLTLDIQQIGILQHLLKVPMDTGSGQDEITLHITEEREAGHVHLIRCYADNIIGEVTLTGTLTNPPSPFPRLRAPLSRITVNHRLLADRFTYLEQRLSSRPALIQLSLEDTDGEGCLRLSVGPLDSSIGFSIPGTDSKLIGPSLHLSLDYRALYQVATRAPDQMTTWQIYIDRDGSAVQLLPENGKGIWQSWQHQLWHREI